MAMFEIDGGKNISLKRNSTSQETLLKSTSDIDGLTAHDNIANAQHSETGLWAWIKGFFAHGITATVVGTLLVVLIGWAIVKIWPAASSIFH